MAAGAARDVGQQAFDARPGVGRCAPTLWSPFLERSARPGSVPIGDGVVIREQIARHGVTWPAKIHERLSFHIERWFQMRKARNRVTGRC